MYVCTSTISSRLKGGQLASGRVQCLEDALHGYSSNMSNFSLNVARRLSLDSDFSEWKILMIALQSMVNLICLPD